MSAFETESSSGDHLVVRVDEVLTVIDAGLLGRPHTIHITTPTGHHYLSRAPDPP